MTTAVVSDLHLGEPASVLGTPHTRARLIAELEAADRVVLLGDVVALRGGRVDEVIDGARPFFEELAEALRGRTVVLVPGNHDHGLVQPLLDSRRLGGRTGGLGLEWVADAGSAGPVGAVARHLEGMEVLVAYPGIWLRPDVYATHGHYLDCHLTVPRIEGVAAAVMEALAGGIPEDGASPEHYEAVLAPIYALAHARAQYGTQPPGRIARHTWAWVGNGNGRRPARSLVAGALVRAALAAANRAGFERFRADLSLAALDRGGVRAMGEVLARLGVAAPHVIFGHTHRAGPIADESGWQLPAGTRLVNTGSWVYTAPLIGTAGARSPYWPGVCALVRESGPPELRRVLEETVG